MTWGAQSEDLGTPGPGVSGGLASRLMSPGSSARGPWPSAGRRLPAAPRGTGWGPAAGRGRRSGGSGSLPLARAQESAEGRAEEPGWAAPRRAGGPGALPGAARPGSCAVRPSACPQALPEPAEQPEPWAAGASRAQVSGGPWREGGSRSLGRVGVSEEPREACAPLPAPLGDQAGAGRPQAGGPPTPACVRSRPSALEGSGASNVVPTGRRLGSGL